MSSFNFILLLTLVLCIIIKCSSTKPFH